MPSGYVYDAAGNVLNDGVNQYLYDGEDRICAVKSDTTGALTGYIYDASGARVGKGTLQTFSCNLSSNGFAVTSGYVVGLNGEQLTETNGGTGWLHTHVFANGQLLATYSSSDTWFELNDWLGTRRADVGVSGCETTWQSLPYGDALTSSGNCTDTSELHFTGKERDEESGLDHFPARYYSSPLGRWMSPDPYMGSYDPSNPQTFNRYSYVLNNPLAFIDPLGRQCVPVGTAGAVECTASLAYDGAAAASGSGSLAWLGSLGGFFSNPITAGIVGGGLGIYELGHLFGWWGSQFHGSLKPRPNAPNMSACTNGLGTGGIGVGAGYNADLGVGDAGASSTGGVGAGLFHNSAGGAFGGYSGGLFASGGATAYAGPHLTGVPSQTSSSFVLGGYAGAGANLFFTNAGGSQQLAGPFTTVSVDVGVGIANLGVQLSFANGIWQFSVTPPIASVGFGAAGSVIRTNTIATHAGCH